VLEAADFGKGVWPARVLSMKKAVGHMRLVVIGDTWVMTADPGQKVFPRVARLDPTRNPKWVDLQDTEPGSREVEHGIYELTGDRLQLCLVDELRPARGLRAAEFNTEDNTPLILLRFRREPPPARPEGELVGSWVGTVTVPASDLHGKPLHAVTRVEVTNGFLFAFVHDIVRGGGDWLAGKYTLNTAKSPCWIDLDLVGTFRDRSGAKMDAVYGSYQVADGRLRLIVGTTGKRSLRPLDLGDQEKSDPPFDIMHATGVMFFNLGPTREPLAPVPGTTRIKY
jgi:uncharacterized protein (TIGR03067 family)